MELGRHTAHVHPQHPIRVQGDELVLATGQRGVDTDCHAAYYPLLAERQQNGCSRQDTFGATKRAETISGGRLDRNLADRATQGIRERLTHWLPKRRQTRLMSDDREIRVFEPPVLGGQVLPDVAQHLGARRTAPALVGGREPIADVTEAGRAEQGVDQPMDNGIAVRVASEAAWMGDQNTAEPQRDALCEGVDIDTRANAQHRHRDRSVRASAKSSGVVTLKARSSPAKTATLTPSCSTRTASSVTSS